MLYTILFSSNLTASEAVMHFLITVVVFMFSLSLHEFTHAFTAFKCGDSTAKMAGRMSLNPFKHIDFSGFMFFMFLGVGWAKPVPINPINFKKYKKGIRAVSIAGVLSNFLFGLLASVVYAILLATVGSTGGVAMQYVYTLLAYIMLVNSFLTLFNLLPIPPLDGFNFVASFCKTDNKFLQFMAKNGFKILIGILLSGLVTELLFGFDIFNVYLGLIDSFIYTPISLLGVL